MAIHKRFDRLTGVIPGSILCAGAPRSDWDSTKVWANVTCKRCLRRSKAAYASMRKFSAGKSTAFKSSKKR